MREPQQPAEAACVPSTEQSPERNRPDDGSASEETLRADRGRKTEAAVDAREQPVFSADSASSANSADSADAAKSGEGRTRAPVLAVIVAVFPEDLQTRTVTPDGTILPEHDESCTKEELSRCQFLVPRLHATLGSVAQTASDVELWFYAGCAHGEAACADKTYQVAKGATRHCGKPLFARVKVLKYEARSPSCAWRENRLARRAFEEGADCVLCAECGLEFASRGWDAFVANLLSAGSLSAVSFRNSLGQALTRCFAVNRKHYECFGALFDRSVPDWLCTWWLLLVYRSVDRLHVPQKHAVFANTRHTPPANQTASMLAVSAALIAGVGQASRCAGLTTPPHVELNMPPDDDALAVALCVKTRAWCQVALAVQQACSLKNAPTFALYNRRS